MIDRRRDLISISNHGFSTGDQVEYNVDSGEVQLVDLQTGKTYEVFRYTNNTFGLKHVAGQGTGTAGQTVQVSQGGMSIINNDHQFTVSGLTAGVRYVREITAVASDTVATMNQKFLLVWLTELVSLFQHDSFQDLRVMHSIDLMMVVWKLLPTNPLRVLR